MAKVEAHELVLQNNAMHCAGCEARIRNVLSRMPGVKQVKASHKTQRVQLALDPDRVSIQRVREKLEDIGYKTVG